jgi:hypothetical protein
MDALPRGTDPLGLRGGAAQGFPAQLRECGGCLKLALSNILKVGIFWGALLGGL